MSRLLPLAALVALAAGCPTSVRYADCQAGTVELRSDPANCGGCRLACPESWSCRDGVCVEPPAPEPVEPVAPLVDSETGPPCCPPE